MDGKRWTVRCAVIAAALAALGLMAVSQGAAADELRLGVRATIAKRATLKVLAQPQAVVITAADIARGWVDVPGSAHVTIRSNSPAGYMLVFASEGDFVQNMRVRGVGHDVQMGAGGGIVPQSGPAHGVTHATLQLGFRFELAPNAREGTFAWPVQMSVAPM